MSQRERHQGAIDKLIKAAAEAESGPEAKAFAEAAASIAHIQTYLSSGGPGTPVEELQKT